MPVKLRKAKERIEGLGDVTRRYFLDELDVHEALAELRPKGGQYEYIEEAWTLQQMFWPLAGTKSEEAVWARHREELLAEYIEANPGMRPRCWYRYDAPLSADGKREHPASGESEASFLKRFDLFLPGEEERCQ